MESTGGRPGAPWRRRLARLGAAWTLPSVGGLVLLLAVGIGGRAGLDPHRAKVWSYLAAGTVVPALLLASALAPRLGRAGLLARALAAAGLGGVAACGVVAFVAGHFDPTVLGLALADAALLAIVGAVRSRRRDGVATWELRYRPRGVAELAARLPSAAAVLVVLVGGWFAAVRLLHWDDFAAWAAFSHWRLFVLIAAVVLVTLNLGVRVKATGGPRSRWGLAADAAALALFALASTRVDTLGAPSPVNEADLDQLRFFHWGAAVGPAELVRQGGWLLWDVPSTYGFLSTLAIARMPFESAWQSYYVLHIALTTLSAGLLYGLLRSLRTGPTNWPFAVVATFAAVFLIPGISFYATGPSVHPPLTAFRYAWCYALLAVLLWEYRSGPDGRSRCLVPIAGGLAWTLGVLWAVESAVYCTAIWAPAYALIAWRRATSRPDRAGRIRSLARWLAIPPLMLAGAVGLIAAWYKLRLGRSPDWARYFDYILAFTVDGYTRAPTHQADGPVWVLLLTFAAVSAFVLAAMGRRATSGELAVAAGVWGMLWSASGYYAIRAVPLFLLNLTPLLCTCLAAALVVIARNPSLRRASTPIRASVIPMLAVLIAVGFSNPQTLGHWGHALRQGYVASVDRLIAPVDPSLAGLVRRAGLDADDPIVYLNHDGGKWSLTPLPLLPGSDGGQPRWRNRAWTPALPFVLFVTLPEDKPDIYMRRFVRRVRTGGWLIESKRRPAAEKYPWFYAALGRTHTPVETIENADWRLTRFEPRPPLGIARGAGDSTRR